MASAVVSLSSLVEAARAGDASEVLARTDTARLRRSLVDQIVGAYLKQIGHDRPVKPLERLAANTYGASVAEAMIAKMLTEENLIAILNKGSISAGGAFADVRRLTEIDTSKVLGETESDGGISLHFGGDGWKLSLPTAAVQVLAQHLVTSKGRNG